jgi:hypothetical protein
MPGGPGATEVRMFENAFLRRAQRPWPDGVTPRSEPMFGLKYVPREGLALSERVPILLLLEKHQMEFAERSGAGTVGVTEEFDPARTRLDSRGTQATSSATSADVSFLRAKSSFATR